MFLKTQIAVALVSAAAAIVAVSAAFAQSNARDSISAGDWPTINRDLEATRFSPLSEITPSNVDTLTRAWTYELGGNSTAVPLVVNGRMYLPSRDRVVALDAETGAEVWSYELPQPEGESSALSASTRGVGYWPGDAGHAPRILFTAGSFLISLEAETGRPVSNFGDEGFVDMGVPYRGTPTLYRNTAIVGANVNEVPKGPPGNPRAYDVLTGEQLWEFWTVPRPGQPHHDTWGNGWRERSGTNMWAFAAPIDASRGIVYLPIAGPAPNYYGGGRPGRNVFGNSIVAVDAETGEYLWHFQTVHHDLWDIDIPSGGALFEAEVDGQRIPSIAHVGKSSLFYVLNRRDGEPVIDIEERPVPEGDVPGEWYSPTQPFPVAPPPLSRMSFDAEEDLVRAEDTNADHVAACRRYMERAGGLHNEGPFTPFLYKAPDAPPKTTIQFPGGTGGINWGGIAMDPRAGIAYVNAQETSLVGWVEDKDPDETYSFEAVGSEQPYDRASINGKGPFFSFAEPLSGEYDDNGRPVGPSAPCYRPPWAELVAVDANTGEILWESVLGIDENLPEGKQRVGNSGSAGPTVTAGGLVFVGATRDQRFRAFDASSGEELWVTELENNANANPMSYTGASGAQHVAIVAGDRVVAFRLP